MSSANLPLFPDFEIAIPFSNNGSFKDDRQFDHAPWPGRRASPTEMVFLRLFE
jgi:hypothetical protein